MLSLEEYIIKRKSEDKLNEFDIEKRLDNTRICVNYIFEYFNNYLDTLPLDEKTVLHDKKTEAYRKQMRNYDNKIIEWLVDIYSTHGNCMNRVIGNAIEDKYFLLYDSDAEFRSLSYDIYSKLNKKYKSLTNQSEMVYLFLKDHHRVSSMPNEYREPIAFISDSFNSWIDDTYTKYGVSLINFAQYRCDFFSGNPDIWPIEHKKRNSYYEKHKDTADKKYLDTFCYTYDYKQKNNLFGLDALYRNMPKKSFTRGKKQEFEVLLMYTWLHGIDTNIDYWNTYISIVQPSLK